MNILTANLRHLYQRRGLWLFYAFLGLLVLLSIMAALGNPRAGKGQFIWFIAIAFLIGFITVALAIDVLTKPFSYCLPGHRKTVRRLIFWIGIVISFLGSLPFLAYPGLLSWEPFLMLCSAFCANLIFYWLGVGLAFINRNAAAAIGYLCFAGFAGIFFDLHITSESAIVLCPVAVICVGLLTSIVAWFRLGYEGLARRYCDVLWVSLFDAWNRDKLQRYRKTRAAIKWDKKLKTHPNPWVERFFLGRMQKYEFFRTGRYIWGGLYTTFGVAISQWKGALSGVFVALPVVCFLGYMGPGAVVVFYIVPVSMVAYVRLPVYSSMLVWGGRNERFFTVMILAATTSVLITALVTIIAAFSLPLAAIMPDITLRGGTFTFHAIYIKLCFVPLLMIPIVFTIQLFFFKKPYFVIVTIMLLFMLLFTGGSLLKALSTMINPIYLVVGLLVLSWIIFVAVLYYICKRRCLV